MHQDDDPLAGGPLDAEELALGEALSAWAESDDFDIVNAEHVFLGAEAEAAGRALMEGIVGKDALDRSTDQGNRSGTRCADGEGASSDREVHLPFGLDEGLRAQAAREHRDIGELMRDAIVAYLQTPPQAA